MPGPVSTVALMTDALNLLLYRALRRDQDLPADLVTAVLDGVKGGWLAGIDLMDLYGRVDLPAHVAQRVLDVMLTTPNGGVRPISVDERATQLLRPESDPHTLTQADVDRWDIELLYAVAHLCRRTPGRKVMVPPAVALALLHSPHPEICAMALAALPDHPRAEQVVKEIGEAGANRWPGLTGNPKVSKGSWEMYKATPVERLWWAAQIVCGWATPDELKNVAAKHWQSPAMLGLLATDLEPAAAERVITSYVIPALKSKALHMSDAHSYAYLLLPKVSDDVARALEPFWASRPRPVADDDGDNETEVAAYHAFRARGLLEPVVLERPVTALGVMPDDERDMVLEELEAQAAGFPSAWKVWSALLSGQSAFDGTWAELILLSKVATNDYSSASAPGALTTPQT